MPVVIDDGITLQLKGDNTVTLYERNISVAERKDIRRRMLLVVSEFGYKQKQGEEIDKRRASIEADETLNGDRQARLAEVDEEAAELLSSVDLIEVYAETLSRRFESWDVFVTHADQESNSPLPLTKEAILSYCEKPKRMALIIDIVEKLGEYDKGEEKKDVGVSVVGGSISTVTPASA